MKPYVMTHLLVLLFSLSCSDFGTDGYIEDWSLSTPEAQNLIADSLTNLTARIEAGVYGEIRSLLVVRHGYLVFERYFSGTTRETVQPVYSVTKSLASILIGIAMDRGELGSVDQQLLSFFPEYSSIANLDSTKRNIRLTDVLTMRAGFDWNERIVPYSDPRNPSYQMASSSDWIKFMLDLPMSDPPGSRFRYNSGCSVLLSGVVRNKTGRSAQEYAVAHLFGPLGITRFQWEHGWKNGVRNLTNTGWGLSLRPRDMAKIGQLCLQNGMWDGVQVVSDEWLQESTSNHVSLSNSFSYGYQWWLLPVDNVPGHTAHANDIRFAWGWGDQFIFVIPCLDMVVVSTGENFSGPLQDQAIGFLRATIIHAIRNQGEFTR